VQLSGGLLLPLVDGRRAGKDGDAVIVGVRPEHLEPGTGMDLIIDLIEPLGSETLVHGRLAGSEGYRLTVKLGGPAAAQDRISVMPRLEHLHLFDRTSGKRIDPIVEENRISRLAAVDTAD
jgi:sn-glycerol 3-phosphate transport system ATP-binding protein